jgi:hypothetical protein
MAVSSTEDQICSSIAVLESEIRIELAINVGFIIHRRPSQMFCQVRSQVDVKTTETSLSKSLDVFEGCGCGSSI